MKTKLSRRAALCGLATIASTPPPALGAGEPDPTFALIERHREAMKAFDAACSAQSQTWIDAGKPMTGDASVLKAEEHTNAISDIEEAIKDELFATVPTTLAGTLALVRYVTSYFDGTSGVFKTDGSYNLFDDVEVDAFGFLTMIGDAIEGAIGVSRPVDKRLCCWPGEPAE